LNVDAITHPDYRRQGIFFSALENKALEEANLENVSITYGFPTKASYLAQKKLGWIGWLLQPGIIA
jgi:hypothetical protein